jgi:leader peptidase (prepilin peptidase)/N-methyltransferase
MQDAVAIIFLFAFGACVGSFLNVVVWRLPRVDVPNDAGLLRAMFLAWKGLSYPPSHCPNCKNKLPWYDNIPVFGWIKLAGRCRFCRQPISPRYPIVEAATGLLFVFYYVVWFLLDTGPCAEPARYLSFSQDWPIFVLYLVTVAALLAASLIDLELFIIPIQIPYFLLFLGLLVHPFIDTPGMPGGVIGWPVTTAMALGGGVGLLISVVLLRSKIIPMSFPNGEVLERDKPFFEEEYAAAKARGEDPGPMPEFITGNQVRLEIGKEMLFLIPPLVGAMAAAVYVAKMGAPAWLSERWLAGFAGALFGGLVGAFVVWIVRILASLAFGRIAMGLGDVHLFIGVGAIIGAGPITVAFFIAPFFGIVFAVWKWLSGKGREIPYGPYLSLACGFVMFYYCPIREYLRPGFEGLWMILTGQL